VLLDSLNLVSDDLVVFASLFASQKTWKSCEATIQAKENECTPSYGSACYKLIDRVVSLRVM
jgi:hypothetical protein